MSESYRPLDNDTVVDEQEQIIPKLLAGLSLAKADVSETLQQHDSSVVDMSIYVTSAALSAGQQRLLQYSDATMDIMKDMQAVYYPNVSVDGDDIVSGHSPARNLATQVGVGDDGDVGNDMGDDLLLGGFPEAFSGQRTSHTSMDSVI